MAEHQRITPLPTVMRMRTMFSSASWHQTPSAYRALVVERLHTLLPAADMWMCCSTKDNNGRSPAHHAANYGHVNVLQCLHQ